MKTNKHKTLLLAKRTRPLHARHLEHHFGYSRGTARSYLSRLARQGLLENVIGGYQLTKKGRDRIRYFDIFGCARPDCLSCRGKSGYLTCPSCGNRMSKQSTRIQKEKDFFLVSRRAGVYCTGCSTLILPEAEALHLGFKKEE
jgi:DNA-binding IscR family transcriptional regulator